VRGKLLPLDGTPKLVGILNVTPDSFYDGGRHNAESAAIAHGLALVAAGAAVIDIGGESSRPGHAAVSEEEELARVVPVVAALARQVKVPLSIDTAKPAVARAAIAAGADILNDIFGFQRHPEMADIAAAHGCGAILMHQDAGFREQPGDPIRRMIAFLERSIAIATAAGVPRERLILDPGIGFAKTHEQNLEILGRLGELRQLGLPLLLGASQKSVIGNVLDLPPAERREGTLATTALAVWQGVEFLRVHEIEPNMRAARMAAAIRAAAP
jgi:dihydropteroate synthase